MMKTNLKLIYILFSFFLIGTFLVSCDKDTEGVSKVVTYPVLEMTGESFMNIKLGSGFTDPGVRATAGEEELEVKTEGSVNTAEEGLYTLIYSAEIEGDIPVKATMERKVLVTQELMTEDLYSGTYQASGRTNTMTVKKWGDGYYRASNTWWQNSAIPVDFIDYGGERLVALPGTSGFGDFTGTLTYDGATASFTFMFTFQGGVNDGVSWKTTWTKID